MLKLLLATLMSSMASFLANRGLAVFNDALRPLYPEELEGRMSRSALFATSFAMSFGLVIGYGIPFSLTSSVILIHSILLGTDIIGLAFPRNKTWGALASLLVGALYGFGITTGLDSLVRLFNYLPYNFLPALSSVGAPIIVTYAVFPAVVVAMQYGIKKGAFVFTVTYLLRQFFQYHGQLVFNEKALNINPDGMALLTAILLMLFFAMREKKSDTGSTGALVGLFSERLARIRKNMLPLALMGGLICAAASTHVLAGDPISLTLLADGKLQEAALTAVARSLSFVPLIATTAITTGVYGPAGMTFVFAAGLLITHPLLAFVAGMAIISGEILLLSAIAHGLDRFPGIKNCGDQIRSAMSQVLQLSLLVGAMMAGNTMAGGSGFFFVLAMVLLNRYRRKPLMEMAVGPVAIILFGILLNLLLPLGLFKP